EAVLERKIYKKKEIGKVLEDTITKDLVFFAEKFKHSYNFDIASVHPTKGNKIDILLSYALGLGFERRIGIECKVLEDNLRNDYYVNGGIKRFITGYYSEEMPLAGMIGYVAKGVISEILEDINRRVDKKTAYQILIKEKILEEVYHTYLSIHHRKKDLGNISLYHMFLDFNKIIVM
ncbi:MAG: hypothetical protein GWN16_08305, partial [Calditrichae bacterium]|nr:hypothetical protein [Calditrichia bacterium]